VAGLDHLDANMPVLLRVGQRSFETRVIRRLGRELYLDALREGDSAFAPSSGQEIEIRFGDDVNFFSQAVRVEDVLDPIPIMVVRLLGQPRPAEQRHAIRAHVLVPLEYALMRAGAEVYTTTTLDLSTIGLRFPCAFRPWVGLDLRMRLTLNRTALPMIGRVVRVARDPAQVRGRMSWETAVTYQIPTPTARRRIAEAVAQALDRQSQRKRG
jgi:hypothetical protein